MDVDPIAGLTGLRDDHQMHQSTGRSIVISTNTRQAEHPDEAKPTHSHWACFQQLFFSSMERRLKNITYHIILSAGSRYGTAMDFYFFIFFFSTWDFDRFREPLNALLSEEPRRELARSAGPAHPPFRLRTGPTLPAESRVEEREPGAQQNYAKVPFPHGGAGKREGALFFAI